MATIVDFFLFLWVTLLDWPIGTILGTLLIVIVLSIVAIIAAAVFETVDYALGTAESGYCKVVGNRFTPSHTRYVMVGKELVPQTVDDAWEIVLEKYGRSGAIEVPQAY